jgi:CheY-like chemotaxis protein
LRRGVAAGLIILDLIMPKVTGFELLQTISITPGLEKVPSSSFRTLPRIPTLKRQSSLARKNIS